MTPSVTITYLHHSGFTAVAANTLLVFDYWEGENGELPEHLRLTGDKLEKYDRVYVFISHTHPDHMDPKVFSLKCSRPITYIVSYDAPIGTRGRRIAPGDTIELDSHITVKAFGSTDLGVSFLVEADGVNIFHAGDLNLWHWRQESTLKQIEAAERSFEEALNPLIGQRVDVGMFPVDPRQGPMFDAGANQFILSVKPKLMIPMHFQGRSEVAVDFARRARTKQTEVLALTKPGEAVEAAFREKEVTFTLITPKASAAPAQPLITAMTDDRDPEPREINLNAFDGSDPFADTDLPVEL